VESIIIKSELKNPIKMKTMLSVSLVVLVQALLVNSQFCDLLQPQYRTILPDQMRAHEWPTVINLLQTLTLRFRELSRAQPINEVNQAVALMRNIAVMTNTSPDQILTFNGRANDITSKVIDDYNKAWFDVTAKAIRLASSRDMTSADFEPFFTTLRSDCRDGETAMATGLKTARDNSAQLILDATNPLTTQRSMYSDIFDRLQQVLNYRQFDLALPTVQNMISTNLQQNIFKMVTIVRALGASMNYRINTGPSPNKGTLIATVNDVVNKFAPSGTLTDVQGFLQSSKSDADKAIDTMRALTSIPDYRAAVLKFVPDYAKKADDAYVSFTNNIVTAFSDAVKKINAVVPS